MPDTSGRPWVHAATPTPPFAGYDGLGGGYNGLRTHTSLADFGQDASMVQARDRLAKLVCQPKKVQITRASPESRPTTGSSWGLVVISSYSSNSTTSTRKASPHCRSPISSAYVSGEHENSGRECSGVRASWGWSASHTSCPSTIFVRSWPHSGSWARTSSSNPSTVDCGTDDFSIGRVVALDDESVSLLNFDPLGVWDDDPSVIDLGDITEVQFDTPYINTISKYLEGPPPT